GLGTVYNPSFDPGEMAVDWAGNLFQVHADTSTASFTLPYVALYTEDGNIGTQYNLVSNPAFSPAVPNLGDAAEAFRPKVDFGDGPASYDAASADPAMHEKDVNLRLGTNNSGQAWTRPGTTDPVNDDGIGAAPALDYFGTSTYAINVNVYNNTGATATMVAWLDYNFNGVFEPGEGRIITTIPSSASTQLVPLNWGSFWVGWYPPATKTWLRIRLTSTANAMTTSNIGGYFNNGEVEDYPVVLGTLLARNLVSFTATLNSKKTVDLNWTLNTTPEFVRTVIERGKNSTQWDSLSTVNAANGVVVSYNATDAAPYAGTSYYRLKLVFSSGTVEYSDVRSVTLGSSIVNGLQI
ncbi:MAG TPA: GEVED domain-containing protein, partial [Chitinophagaceae bacterium]|nr:GEVED domain-containing protein [Chitinophagaceae bacterium]